MNNILFSFFNPCHHGNKNKIDIQPLRNQKLLIQFKIFKKAIPEITHLVRH